MARHFLLPTVRLVDNGLQLFYCQGRLRYKLALFVHPGAVRHVDLEPVCSVLELLAGGFAGFHWTVDELRALGHLQFWRLAFEVVSAGRRDCARGAKNPWTGNCAFFNGLFDFDVAVPRAFGLDVSKRSEALLQRAPRREGGTRRA